MTDIKELALQEAKDMLLQHYYDNGDYATFSVELCTRFLAAYLAEQEPVAWFDDHYHDFSHVERFGWKPLYAAPPLPEPAPQQDKQEAGDYGLTGSSAVGAAPSSEEVIALKQLWLADLEQATAELHSTPQSSSEEVRVVVDRLRIWHRDGGSLTARDAADLIERLAARAEKYSELLYAVERKFPNEARHETALRYIRQTEERANSGSSTDAVGVAVPPAPTFERGNTMGLFACMAAGMVLSFVGGIAAWAWLGPAAGALATAGAFGLGCVYMLLWTSQGRTF